jgi:hypothetical protein
MLSSIATQAAWWTVGEEKERARRIYSRNVGVSESHGKIQRHFTVGRDGGSFYYKVFRLLPLVLLIRAV